MRLSREQRRKVKTSKSGTYHLRQAPTGDDKPGMDEAVQLGGRPLDVIHDIFIVAGLESVCYESESMLIVFDRVAQAGEIEPIGDIFVIDLAKVYIFFFR